MLNGLTSASNREIVNYTRCKSLCPSQTDRSEVTQVASPYIRLKQTSEIIRVASPYIRLRQTDRKLLKFSSPYIRLKQTDRKLHKLQVPISVSNRHLKLHALQVPISVSDRQIGSYSSCKSHIFLKQTSEITHFNSLYPPQTDIS
jgi:hypothetical protein